MNKIGLPLAFKTPGVKSKFQHGFRSWPGRLCHPQILCLFYGASDSFAGVTWSIGYDTNRSKTEQVQVKHLSDLKLAPVKKSTTNVCPWPLNPDAFFKM